MARSELVDFIKRQLGFGKDPKTIRDYLIKQNINPRDIDGAFDKVFSVKETHDNGSADVLVKIGIIVMVLLFVSIGAILYFKLTSDAPGTDIVPGSETTVELNPKEEITPESLVQENDGIVCNFNDPEEKYECYLLKFEKDEVKCYEIEDDDEQEFCYIAQDLYALNA
ncbi:MAG: hypothetical protein ABIB43_01650 [archaeon]